VVGQSNTGKEAGTMSDNYDKTIRDLAKQLVQACGGEPDDAYDNAFQAVSSAVDSVYLDAHNAGVADDDIVVTVVNPRVILEQLVMDYGARHVIELVRKIAEETGDDD
jgi:hypothetical protein